MWVLSGALVCANSWDLSDLILGWQDQHCKFISSYFDLIQIKMTRIKVTLGLTWTHYFNLNGMTDRLFEGLREEGWESDKIDEYTSNHLHKVNQALAKANAKGGGPELPRQDDEEWLRRHPALEGSLTENNYNPRKLEGVHQVPEE